MQPRPKAYVAGPDVFVRDGGQRAAEIRRILDQLGIDALLPVDSNPPAGATPHETAVHIAQANKAMIQAADVVIANASPFRGPSCDPGTAFEIGFAHAIRIPVVCWSNTATPYAERVRGTSNFGDETADADGLLVEDFELPENLMLVEAAASWTHSGESGPWWNDTATFAMAATKAAILLRMRR